MRRIFAYPLLWLALLAMWLLLMGSLAPGQVLLGIVIASLACWAYGAVDMFRPRLRRPGLVLVLLGRVVADVFRSNVAVLGLVFSRRAPHSKFVAIPLSLRDPNGLAVLAGIITATPGSAWIHYNSTTNVVLVHVLDTEDGEAWAATLKRDYETLLLEIFR
jgi:multicomponent K+:H+ antiporter subunit E